MNKVLEVKDLSFAYNKNLILENISCSVNKGEFVALVGENGQGKTTFMRLIIGQLKSKTGSICYGPNEKVGYVPQLSAAISNNFPITVKEILALNLPSRKIFPSKEEEDLIDANLDLVGLKDKKHSLYSDLSGGQKQKVMLAKALIAEPSILLLDEPLIGLDDSSKKSFIDLLVHQSQIHNISIIMISHELEDIEDKIDRTFKIQGGRLEEC
ncbi:MAG: ATP-binding cassette domain-containing protein [Bacillota bacterium]|nr:ATP-binding cassette domain-containing protein [Bacillota bacterium]